MYCCFYGKSDTPAVNLLTLAYTLAAAGKSLPLTRADFVSNFVNIVARW